MAGQQFEGRSAAEAAIKACEEFDVSRSNLKYQIVSDEGEGLERRVVISAEPVAGESSGGSTSRSEQSSPRPREASGDRGERGGRGDRGGRGGRDSRGGGRDSRGRRDGRDGGRGGSRDARGGRGGRDSRGPRRPREDRGDGIEALLQLDIMPKEPVALRPEVETEATPLAQRAREAISKIIELAGFSLTAHLVQDDESEVHLDMRGEDVARIIGEKGDVLLSLQFLINRIVGREDEEDDRVVVLDAAGYRGRRRDALASLATRLANRAIEEQKVVRLSPMSAHDRRVFHVTLRELEGVETQSEGDGLYRNLLIIPEAFAAQGDEA